MPLSRCVRTCRTAPALFELLEISLGLPWPKKKLQVKHNPSAEYVILDVTGWCGSKRRRGSQGSLVILPGLC